MHCFSLRRALLFCAATALLAEPPSANRLPKPVDEAIQRIQPNGLKGHVSFLASDLLEGRATPSKGLDIAAEYIASRFRSAGLDPVPGADSYFQWAHWKQSSIPMDKVAASFRNGEKSLEIDGSRFSIQTALGVEVKDARVFKATHDSLDDLKKLPDGKLDGWVVFTVAQSMSDLRGLSSKERGERTGRSVALRDQLLRLKAAAVVGIRGGEKGSGSTVQLIDPKSQLRRGFTPYFPLSIHSDELKSAFDAMPLGETLAKISLRIPAAVESPAELRNVVGILPGSDPVLKDTYILVTAHYDHIGTTAPEKGDGIYNGANDDASGTASVIEIATAFASQETRPKRTMVFMAVFGEERGLLGSSFYGRNPIFPLAKTVADINLEHLGRTDDNEGERKSKVSVTGFDYTNIPDTFVAAGQVEGVGFEKHEKYSDSFYPRSDNQALANAGVPAHTFCAAFEFPDYHGLGDHWEKLDYVNMAKLNRAVAAGLWMLAENPEAPKWNEANEKTAKYRKARLEGNKQ
ncbi:MAG: M28 family peptidase [Candidatus Solibacter usitatus]|nr:M28 family peptidase [Candidatus Solibacter usitatus]